MGMKGVALLLCVLLVAPLLADDLPVVRPFLHLLHENPLSFEELNAEFARTVGGSSTSTSSKGSTTGSSSSSTSAPGSLQILTPQELIAQYGMTYSSTAGSGKTVALVDAYGASTVESDLATFSQEFGLPACTSANGCFRKVNQTGGTTYPTDNLKWGQETALDVQTVHSVAPGAKILLVVCNSDNTADLLVGVQYARANADYVSMSWGGAESSGLTSLDTTYFAQTPKVAFFASAGDNGEAANWPASSPHVVGVGGTSLYTNSNYQFVSEQGWADSGGGCSSVFTAPAVQSANSGYSSLGCNGKRAVPDVAMDANPSSGVYMYYSYQCSSPPNCYYSAGGTSLASPIFASRAAIRGAVVNVTYVYSGNIQFRDITQGSNGHSCQVGLDLVTGLGSWIGYP